MNNSVMFFDATLRDGSHAVSHQYSIGDIESYCRAIDRVGLYAVVVGHGNGLGASSIQVGKSLLSDRDMLITAKKNLTQTKLAAYMMPGFATIQDDLIPAIELGVDLFKIGSHCTEADITQQHIEYVAKHGKEVYGALMLCHMTTLDRLAEEVKKMQSYGAQGVILFDSAGAFTPEMVKRAIYKLVNSVDIRIGFHAHNNLSMAVANTYIAIEEGATIVDGTMRGFGAGAGNCQLEALVALMKKNNMECKLNLMKMLEISETVMPLLMRKEQGIDPVSVVSGMAGVFSGFRNHVLKAAKNFEIDAKDIFIELGNCKAVAGQEDLVIEVAEKLKSKKKEEMTHNQVFLPITRGGRRMNVSEYIMKFFEEKGIDTVFMVSGGQAMWLDDAVGKNKNYTKICTHHEQSATMAADAYGRISGKPAIALVTAGPGSINAMNGVAGGFLDSAPMIVISGQSALSFVQYEEKTKIRQFGVQGINIRALAEPITKYFAVIDRVEKLRMYLEKAYVEATSGRPGPVWIDVPLDIQKEQVDPQNLEEYAEVEQEKDGRYIETVVTKVHELLQSAKKPILLVGQGVSLADARQEFSELISKINVPVLTSRLGIDLIESDNKLYVGRPGNYGERSANFAVQNADLILSIGCRLASSLVGHNPSDFGRNALKVVVDIDNKELDKPGVVIDYKVKLDIKIFLDALNRKLDDLPIQGNNPEWIERCNNWKKHYPVVLPEYQDQKPVNSYYFMDKLANYVDDDSTILVDTGSCFHVACQAWKVKKGQRFLTTGGLSSMGYWVAGIGASLASKGGG